MLTANAQLFEREEDSLERCDLIGSRIVSYCDEGDPYCGTSIFSIDDTVHVGYVDKYGDDVVDLVVNAYNNFQPEFQQNVTGLADEDANSNNNNDDDDDDDDNDDDEDAAVALVPSLYAVLLMIAVFHVLL